MRYDNDVNALGRFRSRVTAFVRGHLSSPRRAATYGLVAAVGTGALLLPSTQHDYATAAAAAPAAVVTKAVTGAAKPAKPAVTSAKAKPAAAKSKAKPAAAKSKAMLNVKPVAGLNRTQMKNAALIVRAGQELGVSQKGQIVAVATAMQESNLYNRASYVVPESLKYAHQGTGADYDSVGLFQQRYTTGWGTVKSIMNPSESAKKFYRALKQVDGWQNMPVTVAAQTVQGSAFPDAYAKHQGNATTVVHAVNNAAQH